MTTKLCPECNNTLKFIQGISKKTGKPYKGWVCPDSPDNCSYKGEWSKTQQPLKVNGDEIIMDELNRLNERLDKMAEFLAEMKQDILIIKKQTDLELKEAKKIIP